MIYQWREDAGFGGDAQVVGEHLTRLANGDQRITPHVVVEDAANADSPLHRFFEWDDAKAAKQHRLSTARHLLAAVLVVREEVSEPQRAYINIRTEDDQSYRALSSVLTDDALRDRMLAQALAELQSIQRRYSTLKELSEVFLATEQLQKKAS